MIAKFCRTLSFPKSNSQAQFQIILIITILNPIVQHAQSQGAAVVHYVFFSVFVQYAQ